MNNLDFIKRNFRILLDENISFKVKRELDNRGFLYVENVISSLTKGINDGIIFEYVKRERLILVTSDRHLAKWCKRRNIPYILINHYLNEHNTNVNWGVRTTANIIQNELIKSFKDIVLKIS